MLPQRCLDLSTRNEAGIPTSDSNGIRGSGLGRSPDNETARCLLYVALKRVPRRPMMVVSAFEVPTDQTIHSDAWRNRQRRKRRHSKAEGGSAEGRDDTQAPGCRCESGDNAQAPGGRTQGRRHSETPSGSRQRAGDAARAFGAARCTAMAPEAPATGGAMNPIATDSLETP